MTASLYGTSVFFWKVEVETGLAAVSFTQSATGSPVMALMLTPVPGMRSWRAARMKNDSSMVAPQTSWETSCGRAMPVVPRLMSAMLISFRLVAQSLGHCLGEHLGCGLGFRLLAGEDASLWSVWSTYWLVG